MTGNLAHSSKERKRSISSSFSCESFQIHALSSDDPLRSDLMYGQIELFEERVEMCFDRFDVTLFYSMVRQLSQQTSVYDITSVRQLRQVYDDEMTRFTHPSTRQTPRQLSKCLQYFTWFCKFLTYLRNLRISFNSRIFIPLFKYFQPHGSVPTGRRGSSFSTSSSLSKYSSNLSLTSNESGIMSDCGSLDNRVVSYADELQNGDDELDDAEAMTRLRVQSERALMLLTNEFKEIKSLYDTSDVKKVAQKLSFVKEQLEFNMDEDETIDTDLLSQESVRVVRHLNADEEIETLLRYIPDILFKFKMAAKLARQWMHMDDQRSRDLSSKLQKIMSLENRMSERLSKLVYDIKKHEATLEKDSEELQKLMTREERSTELSSTVTELDDRIKSIKDSLKLLRKEKIIITNKLVEAVKKRLKREYKTQKVLYESNRLRRYSSERQLATLQFRRDLAEADMHIEVGLKPHLIRSTNDLQDKVEKLEQIIEEERRKERTIKSALIPVHNDRQYLADIVYPHGLPPITEPVLPKYEASKQAYYIGTRRVSPGKANHVKTYRNVSRLPVPIRKKSQDVGVQVQDDLWDN
ncbi:hypothetical protein LOTGIDRAFT_239221 [Lottia gigantea]|uniref:Uncharacterized protein n=1 Tax=Lottia gigantea TaxID=225164 RepID=V4AJ41_LOTGI|nr:hypothetical protein LOTGIDRAFT_239221 [Lottia gigantea]ESO97087.1 hypothetical protein LOTGIDRAFT_239221 [Lottia gigantea]